jgi:hypothetical protein
MPSARFSKMGDQYRPCPQVSNFKVGRRLVQAVENNVFVSCGRSHCNIYIFFFVAIISYSLKIRNYGDDATFIISSGVSHGLVGIQLQNVVAVSAAENRIVWLYIIKQTVFLGLELVSPVPPPPG